MIGALALGVMALAAAGIVVVILIGRLDKDKK